MTAVAARAAAERAVGGRVAAARAAVATGKRHPHWGSNPRPREKGRRRSKKKFTIVNLRASTSTSAPMGICVTPLTVTAFCPYLRPAVVASPHLSRHLKLLASEVTKSHYRALPAEFVRRPPDDNEKEDEAEFIVTDLFLLVAVLPPLLGFVFYPTLAYLTEQGIRAFGPLGVSVDGNQLAVELLRPTATGVVLPTLSIVLGSLLATTINVLRERQVTLRASLNKEACEMRLLRGMTLAMFGTAQHSSRRVEALEMLHGHTQLVLSESTSGAQDRVRLMLTDSDGISANPLTNFSNMLHGVDGAAASREVTVKSAAELIVFLNLQRSDRIAALLSGFPPIHFAILAGLGMSILSIFLVTARSEVLQYLNLLQLRFLFAILVAICSAAAALCVDLDDPFRGSYEISESVEQFERLSSELLGDIAEAEADARAERDGEGAMRQSWGVRDTVYFHLLTGTAAGQIRALGDALAWSGRKGRGWNKKLHHFLKKVPPDASGSTGGPPSQELLIEGTQPIWEDALLPASGDGTAYYKQRGNRAKRYKLVVGLRQARSIPRV